MDSAPVISLNDQTAAAFAVILAVGLLLNGLVFGATNVARGMIGKHRHRRVILPLVGLGFGCFFVTCLLLFMEVAWSPKMVALVVMGGFIAFMGAAGLNAQSKEARK